MLEVLAEAPPEVEFAAAIAVGSSRRGDERLELHIQNLYKTRCAVCGEEICAGIPWQRDQPLPSARIYHCPTCGDDGERPLTQFDLERLNLICTDLCTAPRALSRVAQDGHCDQRESVQSLELTCRARSTFNDPPEQGRGLILTPQRRKILEALLVSVCDDANTLWPWTLGRTRPRQLTVLTQFREKNLWLALEDAASAWSSSVGQVQLVHYPNTPTEPSGICLYPGRIKSILPLPDELRPAAILTTVPRANQAFWTLCALWSGWLWGREAVIPLRSALERRRYDWHWMAQALHISGR